MKIQKVTLCFLLKDDRILLAMKKRGFGEGKWNGVGGKIQEKETPRDAAIRETIEEIRVKPIEMTRQALLKFRFEKRGTEPEWGIECHVFSVTKWEGEPQETEEMSPQWYNIDKIPYEKMWIDDKIWLPKFLNSERFTAEFTFINEEELKDYIFSEFVEE